jgi:hypothetical protein
LHQERTAENAATLFLPVPLSDTGVEAFLWPHLSISRRSDETSSNSEWLRHGAHAPSRRWASWFSHRRVWPHVSSKDISRREGICPSPQLIHPLGGDYAPFMVVGMPSWRSPLPSRMCMVIPASETCAAWGPLPCTLGGPGDVRQARYEAKSCTLSSCISSLSACMSASNSASARGNISASAAAMWWST